ncbi:carbohydrate sulfotransferase 15-like [Mercenaria mercenaria]|uniref:carbohydrate sulfotransferase 15-like n=1 Tax=Mercenaria mercenaria TaxID=6596 RepID=UPI00234EE5F1|nr:carbohydrate sulfotransferase 15-like [Mercenaria mercenaria]XP_045204390.2 carbohydrate sulfotransferase 15-like [Mercenaria mercenaria]XP_045204391.2 carbohydrate sulfotransferase 15-like [Mercenaria mercenaria]XP_045204392.2 carbohydrate sulfotransferase 15-like [Mercenaria mercenaria]XP_045204393.2 carbohydrate sulfotransferase 15-like [Mercenaria mercenaria]
MTSKNPLIEGEITTMKTFQDYNSQAAACITKVKRTFFVTFALMFLTLSVMYGSTERFSNNFQVFRNVTTFRYNASRVLENSIILHKMLIEKETNTSIPINQNVNTQFQNKYKNISSKTIIKPIKNSKYSSNVANVKSQGVAKVKTQGVANVNSKSIANVNSESVTKEITTSVAKKGPLEGSPGTGSKEFPGMPDPCAKPRRNTGVEDILCMKRPELLPEYKNPCWMEGGVFRCLPYFHLIGICKSGTSDFFKRLLLHPDIIPNKGIFGKEIWYWSWNRFAIKDRGGRFKMGMTLKEFTLKFDTTSIRNGVDSQGHHNKVTGHGDPMDIWDRFREEATPQNTPGAEELLWTTPFAVRHINPNVKLLLMLRDPIDRLYSHYFHSGMGTSARSFHDHVVQSIGLWNTCLKQHSIRHCIYSPSMKKSLRAPIYTSFYIVHLKEWLKAFPREQLFIFRNEDYSVDIKGTMRQILHFLDVPIPSEAILDKMKSLPHFYETKKKKQAGPMMAATKTLLIDLYRPYTEELASFLKDDRFSFKDRSFAR